MSHLPADAHRVLDPATCACFPGTCRGGEVIEGRTREGLMCKVGMAAVAEVREAEASAGQTFQGVWTESEPPTLEDVNQALEKLGCMNIPSDPHARLSWLHDFALVLAWHEPLGPAQPAPEPPSEEDGFIVSERQAVRAKPLEWEQDPKGLDWADKYHGFYIAHNDDDGETPFHAAWGEGDVQPFASADEAKAWCQAELDRWVAQFVELAPQPAQPAQAVPTEWLVKIRRLVQGFEHVSSLARLWEPDYSSGSERALWTRATEACADVVKLLAAMEASTPSQAKGGQDGAQR